MRFELTVPFDTTVFKTVAINRTLPHFHCALLIQVVPLLRFELRELLLLRETTLPDLSTGAYIDVF